MKYPSVILVVGFERGEVMSKVDIDAIIKENALLMQQIKENKEKFWKWIDSKLQKRK